MSNIARWHFPPRNGGIDYVQNPSSAHFVDNPIPKLVREILQNSVDAKERGILEPVAVKFHDTFVDGNLVGALPAIRTHDGMPRTSPGGRTYPCCRRDLSGCPR